MSIEYFLAELLSTTDAFIDVFFEVPYGQYPDDFNPFPRNFRLDKLLDKFRKCLYFATRDKECDLARIHYFDTRMVKENGIDETDETAEVYSWSNDLNYCEAKIKFVSRKTLRKDHAVVLNALLEEDERLKKTLESLHKIEFVLEQLETKENTKELLGVDTTIDPDLSNKIKLFFKKETTDLFHLVKWRENTKIILENVNHTEEEFYNAFTTIDKNLSKINGLMTDIYAMARVFKIFDMKQIKEKAHANATDQPSQARNIIIYAGDFHAQSYRKFLKEVLDFDQIEKAGKVEKFRIEGEPLDLEKFRVDGETLRCINMKTISQPFFSEWPPKRIVK